MKRVVGPAGYTIVETMIFLGVSAALFVSASVLIAGRQRRTQFATTVRDFSNKLQSVNGNVASGYYNTSGTIDCHTSGSNVSISAGSNEQGTNADCMYLGQIVVSPQANQSDFKIVSVVGRRVTGNNPVREVKDLNEAAPTLYTNTAETYSLAGADFLSVSVGGTKLVPDSSGSTSIAFIGSLASYNDAGGLQSGGSHTDVFKITSGDLSTNNNQIEAQLKTADPVSQQPVEYCLTNGEQNAKVTFIAGTATYVIGDTTICG